MDFQRSIAPNEMICLPVFVLTCGLSVLLGCMSSNVAMYFTGIMKDVLKYIEWQSLRPEKNNFLKRVEKKCEVSMCKKKQVQQGRALPVSLPGLFAKNINRTT